MYSKSSKNVWALFLLILAGIVLGGFAGYYLGSTPQLAWLNYGQVLGFSKPLVLELGILSLTLGLTIKFNIAGVIGIVVAVIVYRRL